MLPKGVTDKVKLSQTQQPSSRFERYIFFTQIYTIYYNKKA